MLRHIPLLFSFFAALPCVAATTSWEAFDLENCRHWSMTPDDFLGSGDSFEKASKLAKENNSKVESNKWLVVEGTALYEFNDNLYGVCRFPSNDIITCAKGVNFPLSGATYKRTGTQVTLENYQCIRGCDTTDIQMIHDMGYETDELNSEYESLQEKFELKCNENEKRKTFFEEYRKRRQVQE